MNKLFLGVVFLCGFIMCKTGTEPVYQLPDSSGNFTSAASGCGNSVVYKHDSLYTQFIIVTANDESLHIDTIFRTYAISPSSALLRVRIDKYPFQNGLQYTGCFQYCNDVLCIDPQNDPEEWNAISGSVRIRRSPVVLSDIFKTYKISVEIYDAILENANKQQLFIKRLDFDSVSVGWLPG